MDDGVLFESNVLTGGLDISRTEGMSVYFLMILFTVNV